MKTNKNLKNMMKAGAAFSFAVAMVMVSSSFGTIDGKTARQTKKQALTQVLEGNGESKVSHDLDCLRRSPYESTFNATLARYNHEIENREKANHIWHLWRSGERSAKAEAEVALARENFGTDTRHISREIQAWKDMRSQFITRAQAILYPAAPIDGNLQHKPLLTPHNATETNTLSATHDDMPPLSLNAKKLSNTGIMPFLEISEVMCAGKKLQEIGKEKALLEKKLSKEMLHLRQAKAERNKGGAMVPGLNYQPSSNLSEVINFEGKIKDLRHEISELKKLEKAIYEKYGTDIQRVKFI